MSIPRVQMATLGVLALLAASGCVSVPPPPDDLATSRVGSPALFAEAGATPGMVADDITTGWLRRFDDPLLEDLVLEAWAHNPDLYIAAARFEEAAASLRVAGSFLSPELSASGGASYMEYDGPRDDHTYSAGIGVSWETDLWGRLRADRATADSVARSAGLEYLQARHSLAASVAQAYYTIVAATQQLQIDRLLLDAERFTAVTTHQRVEAGLGTSLDDDLAESSVRLAEAAVQQDLAALREARRALEILLGRYPSAELAGAPETLPAIETGTLAIGVPASLLERRPDIRSAELQVDAAYYGVQSARAARLPSLTLSADTRVLFDPTEFITTVAADLFAPVFQGGRLVAREEIANAQQRQALGRFASVSLRAFAEVEGALSNERYLREREASLAAASERLVHAGESAVSRYDQGLLPILDLQQVRRSDFSTRSQLVSVRLEQIRQRLNLYLALGGPVLAPEINDPSATAREGLLKHRPADPGEAPISGELRVGTPTPPPTDQPRDTEREPESNDDR